MTLDEMIRREEIWIEILSEWLRSEEKPIRIETFVLYRAIARRKRRELVRRRRVNDRKAHR